MSADDDWKDEGPSQDDLDWFGDDACLTTTPCPHCGVEMYDDSEWCPSCDRYVVRDTDEWSGKPVWWVLLALAGIGTTVFIVSC